MKLHPGQDEISPPCRKPELILYMGEMVDYCFLKALKDMGVMVPVNHAPTQCTWMASDIVQRSNGLVDDD